LFTPFVPLTFILSPEGRGIFEERQRELWGNSRSNEQSHQVLARQKIRIHVWLKERAYIAGVHIACQKQAALEYRLFTDDRD
jgi:hypothetical protein